MSTQRLLSLSALFVCAPLAVAAAQDLKAYQNYDFVPGDKIVFEDDFKSDTDGEFPAHWTLDKGQAVVNKVEGEPAFALMEGNYVRVMPNVKGDYLSDTFTVEFDFYPKAGGFEKMLVFINPAAEDRMISIGNEAHAAFESKDLTGTYPNQDAFANRWHHAAIVFKKRQLKVYEDQYRVLLFPDIGEDLAPKTLGFGSIADPNNPVYFKNVRIATGGGMNMIDKLTKEGKVVTHGILFDVNQSTIKPQSMGAITQIVKLLKENPAVKLEIGGHTDGDGDAAKNVTLSQSRADAVKKAIVDQGIDAARLTTKGYGASKPVDANTTPEGKANNRRVELTKIG